MFELISLQHLYPTAGETAKARLLIALSPTFPIMEAGIIAMFLRRENAIRLAGVPPKGNLARLLQQWLDQKARHRQEGRFHWSTSFTRFCNEKCIVWRPDK